MTALLARPRVAVAATAAALLLGAGAQNASASSVHIASQNGNNFLVATGTDAEANGFEIDKGCNGGCPNQYRVRDRIPNSTNYNTISLPASSGCVPELSPFQGVICTVPGDLYINVWTMGGNDFVSVSTSVESGTGKALGAYADLGSGNDDYLDQAAIPDEVYGQAGDDAISTGPGNDLVDGGPGSDAHHRLSPTSSNDFGLVGGPGADSVYGDVAPTGKSVAGTAGNDLISGDDVGQLGTGGADKLYGQGGDDELAGGRGDDLHFGGEGGDRFENDRFGTVPGAGADTYNGDGGNDLLFATDGPSAEPVQSDTFFGGGGEDTVDFSKRRRDLVDKISVTLNRQGDDGQPGEGDNVGADGSVENLTGTLAADSLLVGDDAPNVLRSGGYADTRLDGRGGPDTLSGGVGRDVGTGGPGTDVIALGANADTAYADDGGTADVVNCGGDVDKAYVDAADAVSFCEDVFGGRVQFTGGGVQFTVSIVLPGGASAGTATVSSRGRFTLRQRINCPAGLDCRVTTSDTAKVTVPAASAARTKAVRIGGSRYALKAGTKAKVKSKLNRRGRKLLARQRKVKAKVKITVRRGGSVVRKTVRVTLKPRK